MRGRPRGNRPCRVLGWDRSLRWGTTATGPMSRSRDPWAHSSRRCRTRCSDRPRTRTTGSGSCTCRRSSAETMGSSATCLRRTSFRYRCHRSIRRRSPTRRCRSMPRHRSIHRCSSRGRFRRAGESSRLRRPRCRRRRTRPRFRAPRRARGDQTTGEGRSAWVRSRPLVVERRPFRHEIDGLFARRLGRLA